MLRRYFSIVSVLAKIRTYFFRIVYFSMSFKRLFFILVCIVALVLSVFGVEALIVGERDSIVRQTFTQPVKRWISSSKTASNQLVVAIDDEIGNEITSPILRITIDALDKHAQKEGQFLVIKYVDREMLLDEVSAGHVDLVISNADVYAEMAFDDRVKAIASLWYPQAKVPDTSSASTIIVRSDNPNIYTLADLSREEHTIMAQKPNSFSGFIIAKDQLARMDLNYKRILKKTQFTERNSVLDILRAVKNGDVDVGIVSACTIEYLMARNLTHLMDYRVINPQPNTELTCQHSTAVYPSFVVSIYSGIKSDSWEFSSVLYGLNLPNGFKWTAPSNFRELYDLMYRLRVGPYDNLTNSALYRFYQEHRTLVIMMLFLIIGGFMYNLVVSLEVARRTRALRSALKDRDRIAKHQEESNHYISRLEKTGIVGQMSSLIAHELKQPLATVTNYSRGLLRRIERGTADKDTIIKILKEIEYHTDRANEIVDHVRSYAKQREIHREIVDLRVIAAKTVATFERSGRSQIPVVIEGETLALVEADAWEIELALFNLLKNAADAFNEVHPVRLTEESLIRIVIEDHGKCWWVKVIDNAKLVNKELTDKFFKQLKSTKIHGLGLGLSIVNSLTERQAGHVWAEPNTPRGVIITMELPKPPEDSEPVYKMDHKEDYR